MKLLSAPGLKSRFKVMPKEDKLKHPGRTKAGHPLMASNPVPAGAVRDSISLLMESQRQQSAAAPKGSRGAQAQRAAASGTSVRSGGAASSSNDCTYFWGAPAAPSHSGCFNPFADGGSLSDEESVS